MNVRILPIFFALALLGCPPGPPNFAELAERAYPEHAPADLDSIHKLWTPLFKLPQWHFLMNQKTAAEKQPSVESIGGETFLMVFTDLPSLKAYAVAIKATPESESAASDAGPAQIAFAVPPNPHLAQDGSPLSVSMTPDEARAFFAGYKGPQVTGIRFNEGARRGWFAPLPAVEKIHAFLKSDGKL